MRVGKIVLLVLIVILVYCPDIWAIPIRVGIMDNNFASLYHPYVQVRAQGQVLVHDVQNGQTHTFDQVVAFHPSDQGIHIMTDSHNVLLGPQLAVSPSQDLKLQLTSLTRGGAASFNPAYRGILEIALIDSSKLQLINQVDIEEYLYGVLPSEMPVSWPMEALKAQAIASRTYVLRAMLEKTNTLQGYHLDDSLSWQMYNNRIEDPLAIAAVDQTQGLVMLDASTRQIIQAFFHSTSSGVTVMACEVWGSSGEFFPSDHIPYLQSQSILKTPLVYDLTCEDGVKLFLKDSAVVAYDQDSPWYRWQITLSRQELENIINANLAMRYQLQPEFVSTLGKDGTFYSKPIPFSGIGTLVDIEVIHRGAGGNIIMLQISGTTGIYRIGKELNIRLLIRPSKIFSGGEDIVITRSDSPVVNHSILPSATVVMEKEHNSEHELETVQFFGGGNGHGVGMSQWGARGMALDGYNHLQILERFYRGIEFVDVNKVFKERQ